VAIVAAGVVAATGMQAGGSPRDAATLYRNGRFREAYDAFKAIASDPATRRDPDRSARASYDVGNALYRLARFSEALTQYRAALGGPPAVRARAYFNLGDVYMHVADGASDKKPALGAAINAYEDALALDPGDVDAKWNLELALRRLQDEQTRFGKGPHREGDWGGGNLTKSGYAGAPQGGAGATQGGGFGAPESGEPAQQITQTEARRMLDEIQRAQLTGQLGAPPPRGAGSTSHERDW
jgi:Ca-activated chloride channel family protein